MARRKKKFECNHRGFGKFCHRCHNEKNNPKAITKSAAAVAAGDPGVAAEAAAAARRKAERVLCPKCNSFKLTRANFTELADMTKKEFVCRDCRHEFDAAT